MMRPTLHLGGLALVTALILTSCSLDPNAPAPSTSGSGAQMTQQNDQTLDDLRQRAFDVTQAFTSLLSNTPPAEEMQERVSATPPTPCSSGESYRISVGMTADGVADIAPFIEEALATIESVGLSTEKYQNNYRGGDDVSISGYLPDGQSLRLEVTREKTTLRYLSACSADQSLVDAMDQAADDAAERDAAGSPTAKSKPSKWGIRA
ncbi:hypothetical protein GCM10027591_04550 [Zhihengliuella somnathii]